MKKNGIKVDRHTGRLTDQQPCRPNDRRKDRQGG